MNTIGIIAEFNPFHNGHLHLIQKCKELLHADRVIVIMSGDFTQRGAPAFVDKFTRTKMALSCGADVVLELPIYYALGSAEYFSQGAFVAGTFWSGSSGSLIFALIVFRITV